MGNLRMLVWYTLFRSMLVWYTYLGYPGGYSIEKEGTGMCSCFVKAVSFLFLLALGLSITLLCSGRLGESVMYPFTLL